ncbi:hypothetical protein DIT71_05035 [Marinobacter vulgaris]|uniref:Uncharacterized protein n=1 Tax=Marinobacter vulgaris TaxID=1928331 RepID=A0A2V3ZN60_9GAMM|nr:hypothetical protein DIT71_05035 [Marinobacter vulgaris]TSJ71499.1 hypothetical protein FPC41_04435 [Marinobacter vulgaris]
MVMQPPLWMNACIITTALRRGKAPENCAEQQRRAWSIGSVGGLVRPLVLALLNADNPYLATGMALGHRAGAVTGSGQ